MFSLLSSHQVCNFTRLFLTLSLSLPASLAPFYLCCTSSIIVRGRKNGLGGCLPSSSSFQQFHPRQLLSLSLSLQGPSHKERNRRKEAKEQMISWLGLILSSTDGHILLLQELVTSDVFLLILSFCLLLASEFPFSLFLHSLYHARLLQELPFIMASRYKPEKGATFFSFFLCRDRGGERRRRVCRREITILTTEHVTMVRLMN